MATVAPNIADNDDGSIVVAWESLDGTTNTAGDAYTPPPGYALDSVAIVGSFGGTASLEASPDGVNFGVAEDLASVAISATAAAVFNAGGQRARAYKPIAGTGVSDVDCVAYFAPRN